MRYVPFDQKIAPNKWFYIGIFILFALLYGLTNPPVSMSTAATGSDACYMAQKFVAESLKAPATAEFESCASADIGGAVTDWRVKSYVDAQNSFGALLRTHYDISLRYDPSTQTWTQTALSTH